MKVITTSGNISVLSFARGEEVFESLLKYCTDNHIKGGLFTGIGAADELEIAYYHLPTKTYERKNISEEVEIVSLTGNVGVLEGKTALHIHGIFSKRDLSTFGGHLFKLRISGACELQFISLPSPLNRAYDEETGLNLLSSEK
jgi:predicted DNA-binding protein with PD1-like motif